MPTTNNLRVPKGQNNQQITPVKLHQPNPSIATDRQTHALSRSPTLANLENHDPLMQISKTMTTSTTLQPILTNQTHIQITHLHNLFIPIKKLKKKKTQIASTNGAHA